MDFKKYSKKFNLDFEVEYVNNIDAKEDDIKSRFLEFTLFENNTAVDLTNCVVNIYAIKPDGKQIFNNCDITLPNKVLVQLTSQMLSVVGTVKCELMIVSDGAKLTSKVFNINVLESINSLDAIESTDEFNALSGLLSDVQDALKDLNLFGSLADEVTKNIDIANGLNSELIVNTANAKSMNTKLNTAIKNADSKIEELGQIAGMDFSGFALKTELKESFMTNNLTATNANITGYLGQCSKYNSNNFNNYKREGHFFISNDNGMSNAPFGGGIYGKLIVIVSSGGSLREGYDNDWCWQIFLHTDGKVRHRKNIYNAWTAWDAFALDSDVHNRLPITWNGDYPQVDIPKNQYGEDFFRATASGILPSANEKGYIGHSNNKYFYEMCATRFTSYNYRMSEDDRGNLKFASHRDDTTNNVIFEDMSVATDDLLIPVANLGPAAATLKLPTSRSGGKQYVSLTDIFNSMLNMVNTINGGE